MLSLLRKGTDREKEKSVADDAVTVMTVRQMEGYDARGQEDLTVQMVPPMVFPDQIKICAASLIGGRKYQQDAMWYEGRVEEASFDEGGTEKRQDMLAVVCDGMGGLEGGEQASACAVNKMIECFRQENIPVGNAPAFFRQAMQVMNHGICQLQDEKGNLLESGSTAVAVYIFENKLYWFSIGDSKIYLMREDALTCPFLPHNYRTQLEQRLKEGLLTEEEFLSEMARGEALVSFLGMGRIREYEVLEEPYELRRGDIILLCSDGLYKALTEEQIRNLLDIGREQFDRTAELLVGAVRDYGKPPIDNVSVICIGYDL